MNTDNNLQRFLAKNLLTSWGTVCGKKQACVKEEEVERLFNILIHNLLLILIFYTLIFNPFVNRLNGLFYKLHESRRKT